MSGTVTLPGLRLPYVHKFPRRLVEKNDSCPCMSQKIRGRSKKTDRKTIFLFVSRFFHLSFAPLTLTAMHRLAQNSTSLVRATTIAQLVEHHTHHTEVVGSALSHGKVLFFHFRFALLLFIHQPFKR